MTIHKEGRSLLFWMLIILAGINFAINYFPVQELVINLVLIGSILLYLTVLQFFRNPAIPIPDNPELIYAPADGKVVVIEKTMEDEFLKEERIQISIFMSPINVHINRSPISGILKYFKYHPGKYLVAWHPKSSLENERTSLVIEHPNGVQLMMRQIAGAMARRIKWYVKEGDPMAQGYEFGFIKFGSRVDVFVPLDAEILVNLDQKTKGGITPIAKFKS
ncbi:phosphatidylserine decarboxylase family protein [Cyclobacterium qasimii]|uniref:Phosphatidylserine decarboxylase proenzyme n=2 Tax=Cyclobacterium qasimii TaxID=1350429 RepID=A0A512CIV8_9BACT|nr:phosphatidylserine decarboxylase family protein [Cyclobacterium qasimii]GEO24158.1 phosphatidylserine decarboxylase [Cyclobacterium qasimii]